MSSVLLPSCYLPPVQYISKLLLYPKAVIELYEHYPKQTYRNRCNIYGANGKLTLSVPLQHKSERTTTKDTRICYETDWRKLHWRSIESAYRSSPYFEFYEDDFAGFYSGKQFDFLTDLNEALLNKLVELMKIKTEITYTGSYEKTPEGIDDMRKLITPKDDFQRDKNFHINPYYQVFGNKAGFLPNLSVIDLLFNEGKGWKDVVAP